MQSNYSPKLEIKIVIENITLNLICNGYHCLLNGVVIWLFFKHVRKDGNKEKVNWPTYVKTLVRIYQKSYMVDFLNLNLIVY